MSLQGRNVKRARFDKALFAEGECHDAVRKTLICQPCLDIELDPATGRNQWVHTPCKDQHDCDPDDDNWCRCRFRFFLVIGKKIFW